MVLLKLPDISRDRKFVLERNIPKEHMYLPLPLSILWTGFYYKLKIYSNSLKQGCNITWLTKQKTKNKKHWQLCGPETLGGKSGCRWRKQLGGGSSNFPPMWEAQLALVVVEVWILIGFYMFFFFFWLHFKGWGNLSYLTRDWTHAPFSGNLESTE